MTDFKTIYATIGQKLSDTSLDLFPETYRGDVPNGIYARYSIIFSNNEKVDYDSGGQTYGSLMIRIFYPTAEGASAGLDFANSLNDEFEYSKEGTLSFQGSIISQPQEDPADQALSMMVWQVPFDKFL